MLTWRFFKLYLQLIFPRQKSAVFRRVKKNIILRHFFDHEHALVHVHEIIQQLLHENAQEQ